MSNTTKIKQVTDSGAAAPPCSAFPRNPDRDKNGNAVLYPGMIRYEGVAGIFGAMEGMEYVILAPSVEVLEAVVKNHGISEWLSLERCGIVSMERMPEKCEWAEHPADDEDRLICEDGSDDAHIIAHGKLMDQMVAEGGTCPQCGEPIIQPRDSEMYCEECGWPDENRKSGLPNS